MASRATRSARLLLVAAVAVWALTACGGAATTGESADEPEITGAASDLPTKPASSGAAREVHTVESWADVIAKSDLVVVGQATSVAPGRTAGSDVGGRLGLRDVEVYIEEVLAGSFDGTSLTLEELGWKEGQPFTVNQARWAMPGDRMIMGLKVTDNGASPTGGPRYILTSSASRFFLDEGGEVSTNYLDSDEAGWVEWKSQLDLTTPAGAILVIKAMGLASRMPDIADENCGGLAYVLVGVEPGEPTRHTGDRRRPEPPSGYELGDRPPDQVLSWRSASRWTMSRVAG